MFKVLMPNEAWASWVLTTNGRHYLRKYNKSGFGYQYDEDMLRKNSVAMEFSDDFQYKMSLISTNVGDKKKDDDPEESDNEIEVSDVSNDEIVEEDQCSNDDKEYDINDNTIKMKYQKYKEKTIQELLQYDIRSKAYEKTIETLNKSAELLKEESTQTGLEISSKRILDNWLFNDNEPAEAILLKQKWNLNTLEMWKHLSLITKYKQIAELAMRLLSIGTSESCVERLTSMHRYLVHDRMTNVSPEVLLARLRLRAMRNDENKSVFNNPYWKL